MKRIKPLAFCLLGLASIPSYAGIVADHNVVDQYDQIPDYYIEEVKKMLVNIPGESHGRGYLYGVEQLELEQSKFSATTKYSGAPEAYTSDHLRVQRPIWFDAGWGMTWLASAGETHIWTSDTAVAGINNNFTYSAGSLSNNIDVFLWGWCWDMGGTTPTGTVLDSEHHVHWGGRHYVGSLGNQGVWGLDDTDTAELGAMASMDDYLGAFDKYNADNPNTTAVFTTGPADYNGERGYAVYLKNQHIRDHVAADANRILFDYADILAHDSEGNQNTTTWNDTAFGDSHTYERMTTSYRVEWDGGQGSAHISQEASLRLGKAMWWMLARVAGWDGGAADKVSTPSITPAPGSYNDSITITISAATEDAQIFYTIDGSEPTEASTPYTGPITLTSYTEVQARAFKDGIEASNIFSGDYTIIVDTAAPEVASTKALSATQVEIIFNETMNFADITNLDNYTIGNGVTIESVLVENPSNDTVILSTTELTPDTVYTITINNVRDENDNAIAPDTQAQFTHTVTEIPGGLQQQWDFETTSGIVVNGATQVDNGKSGKAFSFNGGTDYLSLGTSTHNIEETNEFTITAWINYEGTLTGNIIIRGPYVYPYRIATSGRYMRSVIRTNRTNYVRGLIPLVADTWNHVALSYKDGERTMYVNGEIDHQSVVTGTLFFRDDAQEIKVGEGFSGIIDEMQIYNKALTPEQVNGLYSGDMPQYAQTPEVTPTGGTYSTAIDITITSATDGAEIYYTLDGSDPDDSSTLYQGVFSLDQDSTLKTIAYSDGKEPSQITSVDYTFDIDTTGPEIVSHKVLNETTLKIEFNEEVNQDSAEDPNSYSISPTLSIETAQLEDDQKTVVLQLQTIPENVTHSMIIFGVEDISGNPVAPSTAIEFIYVPLSTEDSLTGYWSFDESSGDIANDGTPYGNNGQIVGATRITEGKSGGALQFDGGDIVNLGIAEFEIPGTNEFSLSLWFKFDDSFTGHLIRRGPYVYPYRIYSNANRINTTVRTSRTNYMSSLMFPQAGSWYHCVLTYGNGDRRLYVNGQLDNSSALTGDLNFYSDYDTNLGEGYIGAMDEVKIYNKALSAEEVEAIYNQ